MPRTERQRRMLDAMGIRVFEPDARAGSNERPSSDANPIGSSRAASPTPVAPVAGADDAIAARHAAPRDPGGPPPRAIERGAAVASREPAPMIVRPPATDRGGVAMLEWPALQDAVAACRACTLCETRTQTVFGVGHRSAHWMIVGEAPGEQEDLKGEPFVGAAGQLLDAMLRALGLTRGEAPAAQQVYIANTLKCRPPRNRNPAPDELAKCEPFLLRQIELVQPRVILAMGRFAVQSLLRTDDAIGRLRGRVHTFEGRPLVVTYHPAYLLRNPIDKARSWEDLCLAAEVVEAAR